MIRNDIIFTILEHRATQEDPHTQNRNFFATNISMAPLSHLEGKKTRLQYLALTCPSSRIQLRRNGDGDTRDHLGVGPTDQVGVWGLI